MWWVLYGSRKGKANDLKRSIRDHVKELALCMVLGAQGTYHHPCAAQCHRATVEPPPRRGRDRRFLSVEQMRESAKLCQNEELKWGQNRTQTLRCKQKGCINNCFLVCFMIPSFASIRHSNSITPNETSTNKFHAQLY